MIKINEIWKDIVWYEWLYQVSNLWNVRTLYKLDKIWRKLKGKILKKNRMNTWYYSVTLYNHTQYKFLIHRLVAKTFISNPESKPQVNHKDWNKQNNCVDNLEWVTHSENLEHSYKKLWRQSVLKYLKPMLWKKWILSHSSKKVKQFDINNNLIKTWDSISDVYRELKIKGNSISAVCRKKRKTAWWFIWKYN